MHQKVPLSCRFIANRFILQNSSNPSLFLVHSKTSRLVSLCTAPPAPPTSQSPSPIFLPFLQDDEHDVVDDEQEDPKALEEPKLEDDPEPEPEPEDPLVGFFKSRASVQEDAQREGRLSLQKNRRTTWHLAGGTEFAHETRIVTESEVDELVMESAQMSLVSDSTALPEGIVGEILQIARNLPQNLTLGEALGGFEGRASEKECVEVLKLMGDEGLVMSCLYFFEWMGLQEPSLLTPQACSVLFPMLGRAAMGDKLMVLFMNLPPKKEFRDVRVYNAAISGLMYCQR